MHYQKPRRGWTPKGPLIPLLLAALCIIGALRVGTSRDAVTMENSVATQSPVPAVSNTAVDSSVDAAVDTADTEPFQLQPPAVAVSPSVIGAPSVAGSPLDAPAIEDSPGEFAEVPTPAIEVPAIAGSQLVNSNFTKSLRNDNISAGVGTGSAQVTLGGVTVDHRYPVASIGQDGKLLIEFFSLPPTNDVVGKIHSGEKYFGWLGQTTPHIFMKVQSSDLLNSQELTVDGLEDCYIALLNFEDASFNNTLPATCVQSITGSLAPGSRIVGHLVFEGIESNPKIDIQFDVTLPN